MAMGKWISGALGWIIFGPLGGLIGFLVGSAIDAGSAHYNDSKDGPAYDPTDRVGNRNSFLLSFLVLTSVVMKADGKVMRSELNYVQDYIRRSFGEDAVAQANQILKQLLTRQVDLHSVSAQIRQYMNASSRLQLLHYLASVAAADGSVSESEWKVLEEIASAIGIPQADADSVFAMFGKSGDAPYKILEIDPSSSDEEVRKAYKRMVMKHHPDKVSNLGPDVQAAATEKFKQIQEAYEAIKKERNLN